MNYVMVLLLMIFPPYKAFKHFCNLVISRNFLYKTYLFNRKYLTQINSVLEQMVKKHYPKTYDYLKQARLELWHIFWIEWVYAMFLRTFDLRTSIRMWDFMLVKGEQFICSLNHAIFGVINDNLENLNKHNFCQEAKLLIVAKYKDVIERANYRMKHESDETESKKIH